MSSESRLKELSVFTAWKTEGKCSNTPEICKRVCKGAGNIFFPSLWDRRRSNALDLQQGRFMFNITKTFVWKGHLSMANKSLWRRLESWPIEPSLSRWGEHLSNAGEVDSDLPCRQKQINDLPEILFPCNTHFFGHFFTAIDKVMRTHSSEYIRSKTWRCWNIQSVFLKLLSWNWIGSLWNFYSYTIHKVPLYHSIQIIVNIWKGANVDFWKRSRNRKLKESL